MSHRFYYRTVILLHKLCALQRVPPLLFHDAFGLHALPDDAVLPNRFEDDALVHLVMDD